MKKFLVLIVSIFLLVSCWAPKSEVFDANNKIQVTTSIIPLASIASYIWWDIVQVDSIVPAWVSPHNFELKPDNLVKIEKSDLLVYLNLDHIDWFLNKSLNGKNVLNTTEWMKFLNTSKHSHDEKNNNLNESHNELEIDAHVWTSWINAIEIASKIQQRLSEISPKNAVYFQQNLEFFKSELTESLLWFQRDIKDKKQKEFVVFHDAYNYLFDELSIDKNKKLVFNSNVSTQIDPKQLKELIDEVKHHWVKTIFNEPQFLDPNLDKFAKDNKLNVYTLDPIWNDISSRWFLENYKNNLLNLKNIYE